MKQEDINKFKENFELLENEMGKVMVGLSDTIRLTLATIFAGGHTLLEGAPGLGKTLLVRSIAECMGLSFKRIQFTSDLMPSDVTGTQVLSEDENNKRTFKFQPGPIFANIVLADEVNRAGPKTQSSLLEAMEEKQVTVLGHTHKLPQPFFVLATQNPIELEGTYPLPEAQLDRFLVKLLVAPPSASELNEILNRTTGKKQAKIKAFANEADSTKAILQMRELVKQVMVAPAVQDVLVSMVFSLDPNSNTCTSLVNQYVKFGPGPRGAQAVMMISKVLALLDGRANIAYEDIKTAIIPALRHRMILNFQAEADGVTADKIISEVKDAS